MAAKLKLIAAAAGPPGAPQSDWIAAVDTSDTGSNAESSREQAGSGQSRGDQSGSDQSGSDQAGSELLESVWRQVAPRLSSLIAAMGIGQGRREDVLQDVWLAAFQKAPAGADAEQLRRWLVRVAVNRCHLEQRRNSRWRAVWQGLAVRMSLRDAAAESPASQIGEDRELVRRALKKLEPETRSLLILRYFLEFDSAEIGNILGLPDSTVRGRLREARKRLASELKRAGFDHD